MNCNDQFIEGTLDNNFRDTTFVDTCIQLIADLVVFDQLYSIVFFAAVPVAFPTTDNTEPVTDWICFLTHCLYL